MENGRDGQASVRFFCASFMDQEKTKQTIVGCPELQNTAESIAKNEWDKLQGKLEVPLVHHHPVPFLMFPFQFCVVGRVLDGSPMFFSPVPEGSAHVSFKSGHQTKHSHPHSTFVMDYILYDILGCISWCAPGFVRPHHLFSLSIPSLCFPPNMCSWPLSTPTRCKPRPYFMWFKHSCRVCLIFVLFPASFFAS